MIRREEKKKKRLPTQFFSSMFLVNISTIPKNQWIFENVFSHFLVSLSVFSIESSTNNNSTSINKNRRIHDELQGCFLSSKNSRVCAKIRNLGLEKHACQ